MMRPPEQPMENMTMTKVDRKERITIPNTSTKRGSDGPITIFIKVNNKLVNCTVDGGAGASLVKSSLASTLPRISNESITLSSVDGSDVKDNGFVIVPFEINGFRAHYPMLIADSIPCEVLLGQDFLEHYGFGEPDGITSTVFGKVPYSSRKLNFVEKLPFRVDTMAYPILGGVASQHRLSQVATVQKRKGVTFREPISSTSFYDKETLPIGIKSPSILLKQQQEPKPHGLYYIRAATKVDIPPRTKMTVPVQDLSHLSDNVAVGARQEKLYHTNRILVPDMLVDKETKFIEVINPTEQTRSICQFTKLAKIDVVAKDIDSIKAMAQTPTPTNPVPKAELMGKFNINPELSEGLKDNLFDLLKEYQDVFQLDGKRLGQTTRFKCKIDTGDAEPYRARYIPRSLKEQQEISDHIRFLLDQDIVEESESPWAANCYMVPKKAEDGSWSLKRFITDFTGLNRVTKKMSLSSSRRPRRNIWKT